MGEARPRREVADTTSDSLSDADFRAVFESSPALYLLLRADPPRFTIVAATEAFLGATLTVRGGPQGIVGRGIFEVLPDPPDDPRAEGARKLRSSLERVLASGVPDAMPVQRYDIRRPDGTWDERFWSPLNSPVLDAATGQVTHLIHRVDEITRAVQLATEHEQLRAEHAEGERARAVAESDRAELERLNELLHRQRAELEHASRVKTEFLATMSHELRTPLNAIGGYVELMQLGLRGPITEEQRTDLARIRASQSHLVGLVGELLDLARAESGALRVERASVRAADTVDAALALVRPQAAEKGVTLEDGSGTSEDRQYIGDEPRVRQVLVNVLANAIRFTGTGGRVTISSALTDAPLPGSTAEGGSPFLALRIEDTGTGIAPGQLERIFEPFVQAHHGDASGEASPYTRQSGGTGLGLAISRRLARLMGGELTVESEVGVGSAFTIWLPSHERRATSRVTPETEERRRSTANVKAVVSVSDEGRRLAHFGMALVAEADAVVRGWARRTRSDAGIPTAARSTDVEIEDHAATFVTDLGLALRMLGDGGDEAAALMRDGTAILAVIAERHGAQRARLGWTAAEVSREYAHLGEELMAALHRVARPDDARAAERARELLVQLLENAERVSLGGFRLLSMG
jgi:signal transduction histidine kinase